MTYLGNLSDWPPLALGEHKKRPTFQALILNAYQKEILWDFPSLFELPGPSSKTASFQLMSLGLGSLTPTPFSCSS